MNEAFANTASMQLELLLRATLLIGASWCAAAALRKAGASASARHMAWLLGIGGLLALPLLWWFAPTLRLPILPPEPAAQIAAAIQAPPSSPEAAVPQAASFRNWVSVLLFAYATGAALLLLRLVVVGRMLSSLWRQSDRSPDPAWALLMSRLSDEMQLSRPVELRIARGPVMPMTWGTRAPKVLLPAEATTWPAEQRRLVLLHELAHVARFDSLSRSTASLACALYWFHPAVWFAARQLRIEQEHAADDRVLAAGASAQIYARSLVQLARRVGDGLSSSNAAAMAGACQLERRVVAITTPGRRDSPAPAVLLGAALTAAIVTALVSVAAPVAAADPQLPQSRRDFSLMRPAPSRATFLTPSERAGDPLATASASDDPVPAPEDASAGAANLEVARLSVQPSAAAGRTADAPRLQDEALASTQRIMPVQEIGLIDADPTQVLAERRRNSAFGPVLPQPAGEPDPSDSRLRVLERQDDHGHSAGAGARRMNLPVRVALPSAGTRSPSGVMTGASGLMVLVGPTIR